MSKHKQICRISWFLFVVVVFVFVVVVFVVEWEREVVKN